MSIQEQILKSHKYEVAIGIDLGTTHSLIAYVKDQHPLIILNDQQEQLTPSIVYYASAKQVYVGHTAMHQGQIDETNAIITSSKRQMGQKSNDHVYMYQTAQGVKTPQDVATSILNYLKQQAEQTLGIKVKQAVITVPAYFDDKARNLTRQAAQDAELQVLRLINEPTAAALAYGLDKNVQGIYGIYDLGGGTFDFSILKLQNGIFQVLATGGDIQLGGDDFDQILLKSLDLNILLTDQNYLKVLTEVKQLKQKLSHIDQIEHIFEIDGQLIPRTLTNHSYQLFIQPLIERTLVICQQVMQDAKLTYQDIQGIVLVGGATRTPSVKSAVADFFQQHPLCDINPDHAVALGAALQAHTLTQGGDIMLLDVNSLSLGIEVRGGLFETIIPRNSPVPISKLQNFTTYENNQQAILIHVLQGEDEQVSACRSLARFELRGIPPMPAGVPVIQVCFALDADNILTVKAQEKITGTQQQIIITS